jgi:hypothetical protein
MSVPIPRISMPVPLPEPNRIARVRIAPEKPV